MTHDEFVSLVEAMLDAPSGSEERSRLRRQVRDAIGDHHAAEWARQGKIEKAAKAKDA